ncbi:MAG: glucose-1-phosphate cytidylyltransferase, partial [Desulfobacterales bacterium]
MKTLILAGGLGTRISEETDIRPKPMVEIGGKPILWHIMKIYSKHEFNEFIILLGYKGYVIKEYFANYFLHQNDVTFDLCNNRMEIHSNTCEPWKVTLIDTGVETMTGGRILRAKDFVGKETFMLTYGDGVADIDLRALLNFHQSHSKALTMTAVQPEGRFGAVDSNSAGLIESFHEKPRGDGAWINGGFFVCQPKVFDYITEGDRSVFERAPLEKLAQDRQIYAYKHRGFWKCMDTLRDKVLLNHLWENSQAK